MDATTHTDLRKNLREKLDKVHDDNDVLIVKRKNDKDVVILSLTEYNSLIETDHLLSSPANVKLLLKAVEDVDKGKNLIDVDIDD